MKSKVLHGTMASLARPRRIDWLWPGRIARGKVSLIAGDPGLGKSQLACLLAATVSTGGRWPFDEGAAPLGGVVLLNAEDEAGDTMVPRLIAAGADLSNIAILDGTVSDGSDRRRMLSLKADVDALDDMLEGRRETALVVVDPVSAFLGTDVDSHKQSDVRGVMAPLGDMAARRHCAVVLIAHLNKAGGADAISRVAGSGAFVAASRSTLLVARDASDPERRLLLPAKNNLARDVGGLSFRLDGTEVPGEDGPIATSRLVWTGQTDTTANEALRALVEGDEGEEDRPALEEAKRFLQQVLANGPVPATDVRRQAKEAVLGWNTVRRAKDVLGIAAVKTGKTGPWLWQMPEETHPPLRQEDGILLDSSGEESPHPEETPPNEWQEIPTSEWVS